MVSVVIRGGHRKRQFVPVAAAVLLSAVLVIRFYLNHDFGSKSELGATNKNADSFVVENTNARNRLFGTVKSSSSPAPSTTTRARTSGFSKSAIPSLPEFKNAGFCSPSECPQQEPNRIRQSWVEVPNAPDEAEASEENSWTQVNYAEGKSFSMLIRSARKDNYISGTIAKGKIHDPEIRDVLKMYLQPPENGRTRPIFLDVGANIGFFSAIALSMGAEVISFEPFLENAAVFMSTVRKNGWRDRSHHYLNAVSYKTSSRVKMQPTNARINLSNMFIRETSCRKEGENSNETYGVDYMEAVSLDMVMLIHHKDISRVNLMKIDVEKHELHVLNGAMNFLCNRIVDAITVEVEYLKPFNGGAGDSCKFEVMRTQLEQMGYTLMDTTKSKDLTNTTLSLLPPDVLFVQQYLDQSPARRLEGASTNPCRDFTLSI